MSVNRVSAGDKTEPRSAIEMSQTEVKLNDLPELPFELILSYLSLADRIKSRAVSRRWYDVINSFRSKSLCFSKYPIDFIYRKNSWVIKEFAQNFISSTKFGPFFQTFGQSILVNLKHLRLCKLDLNAENTPASLVQIVNSFGQLEELDLYDINRSSEPNGNFQVRLNLPMLKSVQLRWGCAIDKLTLDAPRLQNFKLVGPIKVELVHGESVEKLIIDWVAGIEVAKMKNLKYLYCGENSIIDSTLLSTLDRLKEIYLLFKDDVSNLFQQKAQYGRSNLKIFLCGCLLNDPAIDSLDYSNRGYLAYLAEHSSRLAKEMQFCDWLFYSAIEAVDSGLEIDPLKRFTDLECIDVHRQVQNVNRFLELLHNLKNINGLSFSKSDQQPELFDRLPDHCAVQYLRIEKAPADLNFLFRLKSLICLRLPFLIDIELVPRVLEELPFLSLFYFLHLNTKFGIAVDHSAKDSKQFTVWLRDKKEMMNVSDVNAVIQWISEKAREDEELEDKESEELNE